MISHQCDSDHIMLDLCDGSYYRSHSLFNETHLALQICLYFDELEVCNLIGSKGSIHKIGTVTTPLYEIF